jgi:hypothetical protein
MMDESASAPMNPEPARALPRVVSREPEAPAIESGSARFSSVAKRKKRSPRTARYTASLADAGMPPLPPRSIRAQYLGTTPEGELIFGLPSSERVYAAPAAARVERPRRGRRVIRDRIQDLPVLPALPPDE